MADTYQLELTRPGGGHDPEDFQLRFFRTGGTSCTEIDAKWLSETYWVPQISNGVIVAWDTEPVQDGEEVPCTACVKPKLQVVEFPCMETLCIVDDDYCTCDGDTFSGNCDVDEGPLVYDPDNGPNGLMVRGLEFDISGGFSGDACETTSCDDFYTLVNSIINPCVLQKVNDTTWKWESDEGSFDACITGFGDITVYWKVSVTFTPCGSSLLNEEPHRGILTITTNRGTTSGSLGTGDAWQYYLHTPADGQISLFDEHEMYLLGLSTEGGDCDFIDDEDTILPETITIEPVA